MMQDSEITPAEIAAAPFPPSPELAAVPKSNRAALLIVFLVVFIDLLGFGIILPLLPRYADTYLEELFPVKKEGASAQPSASAAGRPKKQKAAEANPRAGLILGLLMSSFSLMQFIFAPIWGRISDRVGRRPILLLGLCGSVVFYTLFGFASELHPKEAAGLAIFLLFVARLGAGVAGATIATAQAVIADSTAPEHRKHGMALIGAAFGIGFTFGPLIGFGSLKLLSEHPGVIGYVAAGLSLIALVLGVRLMPETRKFGTAPTARKWVDWRGIKEAFSSSAIWPVVLTFFLATFGFAMFEPTLALLIGDSLGLEEDDTFLVFAYVGFILLLAQGLLYRRLARRVTEPTFMFFGILLMGLGVASLGGFTWLSGQSTRPGFGGLLALLLVCLAFAVVGFALLTPSAQALVSRRSDPAKQGEILGANQSASAMARILGPFVGLVLYKLEPSHVLPYIVGAALVLLMLPLIPRVRRG
jgi:MFS family permease